MLNYQRVYYVYYLPMDTDFFLGLMEKPWMNELPPMILEQLWPSVPQAAGLELAVRAWWRGAKSGCGRKEVRGA